MREQFRRRHLPHWDVPGGTYFITACLAGSIPAQGLLDLSRCESQLANLQRPDGMLERDWTIEKQKRLFVRREHWLDHEPAVKHFARPDLANVLRQALYHFAGDRYDLLAYVIMPSHFHWVFRPREDWVASLPQDDRQSPRERIMHSIKRHSALRCNELLGLSGPLWQDESYDHVVRDEDELHRIVEYVERNPVAAGLVAEASHYRYSSAFDRVARGDPHILTPLLGL